MQEWPLKWCHTEISNNYLLFPIQVCLELFELHCLADIWPLFVKQYFRSCTVLKFLPYLLQRKKKWRKVWNLYKKWGHVSHKLVKKVNGTIIIICMTDYEMNLFVRPCDIYLNKENDFTRVIAHLNSIYIHLPYDRKHYFFY